MDNNAYNGETKPILPSQGQIPPQQETRGGWTVHLVLAASAAVIGSSFQFGYNTGVINAPGDVIKQFINETYHERYGVYVSSVHLEFLWGVTVSIFAIGGMVGSFAVGYLAARFGRKRTMLANNLFVMVAIAFMSCSQVAKSYEMLIIGRLIIGVNCGINTGIAPLYLTEIAPITLRGLLGTSNQLGIVTAILLSQVLGLSHILGTKSGWPLLLLLSGVFALYQLLALPFCPETPSYLLGKGMEEDARSALKFLRGSSDVDDEISQLLSEQSQTRNERTVPILEIFKKVHFRKAMIIAMVLQLAQQLSGINAVFYYSTDLFESAGVQPSKSDLVTVGIGVANIVMTLVSLLLVERLGRRILLLIGLAGMWFCSVLLVVSLTAGKQTTWGAILAVVMVVLFVVAFQTGPGSIPWFITAEIFTHGARASATSVAGLVNWFGNFIVGIGYPLLQESIAGYTFVIFACLLAAFFLFTYLFVPETKGKTTEEIASSFRNTH